MKAVLTKAPGGTENLYVGETSRPQLKHGEVLIQVHSSAVNRADILQRQGSYPPPEGCSTVIGLECAGVIEEIGEGVTRPFKKGDHVMALVGGGGYAQYCAAHEGSVLPIPIGVKLDEAGAIPEAWLTAFQTSYFIGKVSVGDIVLIHAAASGVGTAAIQLCKLFGAKPIAVVGSQDKIDYCLKLGAVKGINYKTQDFGKEALAYAQEQKASGVNLVLDCVGASHALQHVECLAMDGRWVLYGTMGGGVLDKFPIGAILRKRIQLTGTTLRTRSLSYKAQLVKEFSEKALPHFGTALFPIVDKVYPLSEVAAAHDRMESNLNTGKIVLSLTSLHTHTQ